MVIAHMRQSVSQMKAILLKSEEEIRFLILYEKERLLHEDMDRDFIEYVEKMRDSKETKKRRKNGKPTNSQQIF